MSEVLAQDTWQTNNSHSLTALEAPHPGLDAVHWGTGQSVFPWVLLAVMRHLGFLFWPKLLNLAQEIGQGRELACFHNSCWFPKNHSVDDRKSLSDLGHQLFMCRTAAFPHLPENGRDKLKSFQSQEQCPALPVPRGDSGPSDVSSGAPQAACANEEKN